MVTNVCVKFNYDWLHTVTDNNKCLGGIFENMGPASGASNPNPNPFPTPYRVSTNPA